MNAIIEKYDSLLKLLKSTDEENHSIALSLIEANFNYSTNLGYCLLLYKNGTALTEKWQNEASTFVKHVEDVCNVSLSSEYILTYKTILRVSSEQNFNLSQYQFLIKNYLEFLIKDQKRLGYDCIENIVITFKVLDSKAQQMYADINNETLTINAQDDRF